MIETDFDDILIKLEMIQEFSNEIMADINEVHLIRFVDCILIGQVWKNLEEIRDSMAKWKGEVTKELIREAEKESIQENEDTLRRLADL